MDTFMRQLTPKYRLDCIARLGTSGARQILDQNPSQEAQLTGHFGEALNQNFVRHRMGLSVYQRRPGEVEDSDDDSSDGSLNDDEYNDDEGDGDTIPATVQKLLNTPGMHQAFYDQEMALNIIDDALHNVCETREAANRLALYIIKPGLFFGTFGDSLLRRFFSGLYRDTSQRSRRGFNVPAHLDPIARMRRANNSLVGNQACAILDLMASDWTLVLMSRDAIEIEQKFRDHDPAYRTQARRAGISLYGKGPTELAYDFMFHRLGSTFRSRNDLKEKLALGRTLDEMIWNMGMAALLFASDGELFHRKSTSGHRHFGLEKISHVWVEVLRQHQELESICNELSGYIENLLIDGMWGRDIMEERSKDGEYARTVTMATLVE